MSLFQRAIRLFLTILGLMAGLVTAVAALFARKMIRPPRQPLGATPRDAGLEYEDVQFPAEDGVRLSGWFLPTCEGIGEKKATIILLHGWAWNRLGDAANDLEANILGSKPVEFLRLAHALVRDGYHVLMFDLRNHGLSAAAPPVTFGLQESNDLLGALAYVNGRSDVDAERIGVIGFSMGANALLQTLPHTDQIKAGIAVQPTTGTTFARRQAVNLLGPVGQIVQPLAELFYRAVGGPAISQVRPAIAAANAGNVPLLFLQGQDDPWGSADDVATIAAAAPNATAPQFVPATHRYDGYVYLMNHPMEACAFFGWHLAEGLGIGD